MDFGGEVRYIIKISLKAQNQVITWLWAFLVFINENSVKCV